MSWIKDKSWKDLELTPAEKDKSIAKIEVCKTVLMGLAFVMSQSLSEADALALEDMPDKITAFVDAELKAKGITGKNAEFSKIMLSATWAFSHLNGMQEAHTNHEKGKDCGKTE